MPVLLLFSLLMVSVFLPVHITAFNNYRDCCSYNIDCTYLCVSSQCNFDNSHFHLCSSIFIFLVSFDIHSVYIIFQVNIFMHPHKFLYPSVWLLLLAVSKLNNPWSVCICDTAHVLIACKRIRAISFEFRIIGSV